MNDYSKIPSELKDVQQWVNYMLVWNEEEQKYKKIPINPHTLRGANTTDSATWTSFDKAIKNIGETGTIWDKKTQKAISSKIEGVGFILDNGYFGIDLDHVKENGQFTDKAMEIVKAIDSYTEESLSGDGIHVIARGFKLTSGMEKRNDVMEIYSSGRFFVMTGKAMNGKGIEERSEQAAHLWNKYLKKDVPQIQGTPSFAEISLSDNELLTKMFKSQKGAEIHALWNDDITQYSNDRSRADLALISHLLFWTNGDATQTDSLFRQSKLMRDKWDELRGADTYGNLTIQKAMQSFQTGYNPNYNKKPTAYDSTHVTVGNNESHSVLNYEIDTPPLYQENANTSSTGITIDTPTPHSADKYLEDVLTDDIEKFKTFKDRKTGFSNLDKVCGGLYPGLYAVGAISSLGKTTFIQQLGDQLAKSGEHILFFSLEQNRFELVTKSLSRLTAQININKATSAINIRRGEITPEVVTAAEMYKKYADRISVIECNFDTNIHYILNYVNEYININGVRPVIIVDYLQIIPPTDPRQSDKGKIDSIVRGLKKLQSENDLVVLVISSLNRSNYLVPVDFESFKESGGIEYTADVIWGLQLSILNDESFRKAKDIADAREKIRIAKKAIPRKIELVCLKNRYGISSYSCGFLYNPVYDLFVPDNNYRINFDNDKPKKVI